MKQLGLRAALTIAAVYGFFLLFAQFSFVELLRADGLGITMEKTALGVMAVAGMAGGFLTAWRGASPGLVRGSLAAACIAAVLAPLTSGAAGFLGLALVTGGALGSATVAVSAMLPSWCGVAWVGLGTGLGYAFCNLPAVFLQSPGNQAWIASGCSVIGFLAIPSTVRVQKPPAAERVLPAWRALALFTALVWLDSAAFFIIQHSGDLKSGTWGETMLWRNAAVHLLVACLAGSWLARGGVRTLQGTAWMLLAVAALAVNGDATRGVAGWLYPAGVSLYSTALVAWPAWFSGADGTRSAGWRAAWLFAVAGWFGSANGIGMAESLEKVPLEFVAGSGAVVGLALLGANRHRWREALAVGIVGLIAWLGGPGNPDGSAFQRGRHVYISEGCIHCHSQYVRPGTADEEIWGPAPQVEEVMKNQPVLIGNRRQGPDLTHVGARRSDAWLKLHFIDPRALVPESPMPGYGHLFADNRGADLVRYLRDSGIGATAERMRRSAEWRPRDGARSGDGAELFAAHCAACHGAKGLGDGPLAERFLRPPSNLANGPFLWTASGDDLADRTARLIKFGIVGTDMPGHETLTDPQITALVDEVIGMRTKQPTADHQ